MKYFSWKTRPRSRPSCFRTKGDAVAGGCPFCGVEGAWVFNEKGTQEEALVFWLGTEALTISFPWHNMDDIT